MHLIFITCSGLVVKRIGLASNLGCVVVIVVFCTGFVFVAGFKKYKKKIINTELVDDKDETNKLWIGSCKNCCYSRKSNNSCKI